jgi:hypothetical protein
MLDSGVHQMAALRLAAAGDVPLVARAVSTTQPEAVSSPDTIVGTLEWKSGMVSSVSLSLSTRVVRLRNPFPLSQLALPLFSQQLHR